MNFHRNICTFHSQQYSDSGSDRIDLRCLFVTNAAIWFRVNHHDKLYSSSFRLKMLSTITRQHCCCCYWAAVGRFFLHTDEWKESKTSNRTKNETRMHNLTQCGRTFIWPRSVLGGYLKLDGKSFIIFKSSFISFSSCLPSILFLFLLLTDERRLLSFGIMVLLSKNKQTNTK